MPGHGRDTHSVASSSRHSHTNATTTTSKRHNGDMDRSGMDRSGSHRDLKTSTRGRGREGRRRSSSVADKENIRDGRNSNNNNTKRAASNTKPKKGGRESRRDREENRTRQPSASRNNNRRSASRARRGKSRSRTEATAVAASSSNKKRGSLPKQTSEKKFWARRDAAAIPLTASPNKKKKAPIRRTRSYESISHDERTSATNAATTPHNRRGRNRSSWATPEGAAPPMVDERGFPMTSVGCAPVASLRTISPNNVETEDFDAMYARKLQAQENAKRGLLVKRSSCSNLDDRKLPAAVEDDRKMPAKRRARSKSCKRKSATSRESRDTAALVPLNPEESLQRRGSRRSLRGASDAVSVPMNPEESSLQRQVLPRLNRSDCAGDAKKFVQKLQSTLEDAPIATSPSSKRLLQLFASVLTDKEMIELVVTMLRTQDVFCQQGKPTRVDVGYHFCRGSNIKRIQQQQGLWAKIQERGVNKSQDGDGIFTFDNPLSTTTTQQGQSSSSGAADDVWMLVARLQGSTAPFPIKSRRRWSAEIDALVRPEDGVVLLKTSTQFFPLVLFRSAVLNDSTEGSRFYNGIIRQIQTMQENLQLLLDEFFQPKKREISNMPNSPARARAPETSKKPAPKPEPIAQEDKRSSATRTPSRREAASLAPAASEATSSRHRDSPPVAAAATTTSRTTTPSRHRDSPPVTATAAAAPNRHDTPIAEAVTTSSPPAPPTETATTPNSTPERPMSFPDRVSAISNSVAWDVAKEVQSVVEEHAMAAKFADSASSEQAFAVQAAVYMEEMAVLAENMFRTQNKFRQASKASFVEIGYHYCRGQNLKKMQQKPGFWSNIQSRGFSRSEDGDGIYTFNNPLGARSRGNRGFFDPRQAGGQDDDVWLLVARLQGERQPAPTNRNTTNAARRWADNVDAMVVGGLQSEGVVVLRTSIQFFPLLQFPASATSASSGNERDEAVQELQMIHQRLQGILDRFFNGESAASVPGLNSVRLPAVQEEMLNYQAPETMDVMNSVQSSNQQIYKVLSSNKKAMNDDCSICLDSLRYTSHQQVVRLRNCGHEFHRACLHEALDHFDVCPLCNLPVTPQAPQSCLQGLSPSGIMVATASSHVFCEGCWAPSGSLILSYFLPAGRQKEYHDRPGSTFVSSDWKAFLPYNEQGVKLLRRLQYAFLHGLLFTLESATSFSPVAGQTTWSTIPHRTTTAPTSGVDDECWTAYFDRCNLELDRCGVPEPLECERFSFAKGKDQEAEEPASDSDESMLDQKPRATLRQEELEDCSRILKSLQQHPCGWMFCKTLPQLVGKVESPLDLTMIEQRLTSNEYNSVEGFRHDVNTLFDVALAHHSKENPVHFMATQLKKQYKKDSRDRQ